MSEPNKRILGEQYYNQVSESVRALYDLSSRIDERVQLMMKKQEELDRKLEMSVQTANSVGARVSVLESKSNAALERQVESLEESNRKLELKVQELSGDSSRSGERWKNIIQFIIQITLAIVTAYLLYKLHLSSAGG